ncbi:CLUMA_CG017769, isoform A [Clunio marinus]|uniref:CLUMA_CG017769, isoform A n=1 Tax=Clunio marinus TaxID=568069 RepID=A0A1J1IWX5_9DIPT|nr:CLUMA_CG017769, isoform A [Clunio marinus]
MSSFTIFLTLIKSLCHGLVNKIEKHQHKYPRPHLSAFIVKHKNQLHRVEENKTFLICIMKAKRKKIFQASRHKSFFYISPKAENPWLCA